MNIEATTDTDAGRALPGRRKPPKPPKPVDAPPQDWITTADIASIMELTREHVADYVVKRAGFPAPVVKLSQRTRRWSRIAVMAYITRTPK